MARSIMEVAFLGTQKTEVDGTKYVKIFYGDEPDGKTEHGLSIVGMPAADEVADELFFAGANFAPLELVRVTFEVARGGQNKGKNLALHIEAVKPRTAEPARAAAPAAQPKPDAK
jgi:hypothetical protein